MPNRRENVAIRRDIKVRWGSTHMGGQDKTVISSVLTWDTK